MTDEKSRDDGFDIPYTVKNPEQLAQNMMRMMNVGAQALSVWLDDKRADNPQKLATEWNEAGSVIAKVMSAWATEPEKFAERQAMLTGNLIDLWGRTNRRFRGERWSRLSSLLWATAASAIRNGRKTRSSISARRPICSARTGPMT
jgi:hypothetical protein